MDLAVTITKTETGEILQQGIFHAKSLLEAVDGDFGLGVIIWPPQGCEVLFTIDTGESLEIEGL